MSLLARKKGETLDAAYRRLAKKYHPNKPGGSHSAFLRLKAAYDDATRGMSNGTSAKRIEFGPRAPKIDTEAFQRWMLDLFSGNPAAVGMRLQKNTWASPMAQLRASVRVPPSFDGCRASTPSIAMNQAVVSVVARLRANQGPRAADGPVNTGGLLAIHSTGSGKTLIGVATIVAFWNAMTPDGNPMPILSVSTPTNQRDNSTEVFGALALKFFGDEPGGPFRFPDDPARAVREALRDVDPVRRSAAQSELEEALRDANGSWKTHPLFVDVASHRIAKRLREGMTSLVDPSRLDVFRARARPGLYTFQKLQNDIKDVFKKGILRHAVFIVDEIHYLNAGGMPGAAAVRAMLTSGRDPETTWCLGMTATPGETRAQVASLLNAIAGRGPSTFSATSPIFPAARGMISVARLESDASRFARVRVTAMCARLDDRSTFSREYLRRIAGAYKKHQTSALAKNEPVPDPKKRKLAPSQSDPTKKAMYFRAVRDWTKFLDVGGTGNNSNSNTNAGDARFVVDMVSTRRRGEPKTLLASPKIAALLSNIRSKRGKHYVFSNSSRALQIVAALMKRELGMTHYNPSACSERDGRCRDPFPAPNPRAPAFVTLDDIGTAAYEPFNELTFATQQAAASRRHVMQAFDNPSNFYGDEIKVVLATKESFKGVDLKGVRYVHLLEPFIEFQDFVQLVGRGPRLCSHAAEPDMSKRIVDVFLYRLVPGKNGCGGSAALTRAVEAADCFLYDRALQTYLRTWDAIEKQLDDCAVDRDIFGPTLSAAYSKMMDGFKNVKCVMIDPLQLRVAKVANPRAVHAERAERYAENGGTMRGSSPPPLLPNARNNNNDNNERYDANYEPPALWNFMKSPATAIKKKLAERQAALAEKTRERARKNRERARKQSPTEGYEPLYRMMERGVAGDRNKARLAKELEKTRERARKNRERARKELEKTREKARLAKELKKTRNEPTRARLAKELEKTRQRARKPNKPSPVEGYEPLYRMMERK